MSNPEFRSAEVRLLEYGTFHDNRYGQMSEAGWQETACAVAKQINARLKRERYADIGPEESRER